MICCSKMVLPEPEAPITVIISPRATARSRPRWIARPPSRECRFSTWMTAVSVSRSTASIDASQKADVRQQCTRAGVEQQDQGQAGHHRQRGVAAQRAGVGGTVHAEPATDHRNGHAEQGALGQAYPEVHDLHL